MSGLFWYSGVVARVVTACALAASSMAVPHLAQAPAGPVCALPESTVVRTEGRARLEMFELRQPEHWFNALATPESSEYALYRSRMIRDGAHLERPIADPPQPTNDAERDLWRREALNEDLMYSGGGRVRAIQCLEAALFTRQHLRYSQLTQPTEFIAHILRREGLLKVYFTSSDQMFPPKSFYGIDEVRADVAAGWLYQAVLHNHTIRSLNGKLALGVPAPSTSDVELFRGLVADLGLREVLVTNGMFTGVVPAENLSRFSTR